MVARFHVRLFAITALFTPLVFTHKGDQKTRYVGYPAVHRRKEDPDKKGVFVDPSIKITKAGVVTGWNVYIARGRRTQTAVLQVWRAADRARYRYFLVGQTQYIGITPGPKYLSLEVGEMIWVQEGDVLGLYYPKYNPVPWTKSWCGRDKVQLFKSYPPSVKVNQMITFESGYTLGKPCRHYSFNASIMDHLPPSAFTTTTIKSYKQDGHVPPRMGVPIESAAHLLGSQVMVLYPWIYSLAIIIGYSNWL